MTARAALIELIDRYNGGNNGHIGLGARELAYELNCSKETAARALRELDDAKLAHPTIVGTWRGRQASEWRLTFLLCDRTGDLPTKNLERRKPFRERPVPTMPRPGRKALTDAQRAQRYRRKRHDNRHAECHQRDAEVSPVTFRRDVSVTHDTQEPKNVTNVTAPSVTHDTHLDIYQVQQQQADEWAELEIPEAMRRRKAAP
jgi:hypothetical protein